MADYREIERARSEGRLEILREVDYRLPKDSLLLFFAGGLAILAAASIIRPLGAETYRALQACSVVAAIMFYLIHRRVDRAGTDIFARIRDQEARLKKLQPDASAEPQPADPSAYREPA